VDRNALFMKVATLLKSWGILSVEDLKGKRDMKLPEIIEILKQVEQKRTWQAWRVAENRTIGWITPLDQTIPCLFNCLSRDIPIRIKTKTKWVPWDLKTDCLPPNALFRSKGTGKLSFAASWKDWMLEPKFMLRIFKHYEYTLDNGKTWLTCGKEVEV
jgi:hypothetical protein